MEASSAVAFVANVTVAVDSRSTVSVTNSSSAAAGASVTAAVDSRSAVSATSAGAAAIPVNAGAAVDSRSTVAAAGSVPAVTVPVSAVVDSRSTIGVASAGSANIAASTTTSVESSSTVYASVNADFRIVVTASANFEVDPELSGSRFNSTFSTNVATTLDLPWWCKKVDALAVGGGGGSSGSNSLARGNGGSGGKWGYNEYGLSNILLGAPAERWQAVFAIGTNGTGGPSGTALGGLQAGTAGGASTVTLRSLVGTTPTVRATTTGQPGAGGSGGVASGGAAGQDGGPVTNGNADSGRDVSLNPPFINSAGGSQQTYNGGATQTTAGGTGNFPGGGGAGKNAGGGVGSSGAIGQAFLRMYSANRVINQDSWATAGAFSKDLPLSTETVTPMALGSGGGGAGGTITVIGGGAGGGKWGRLATNSSFWGVDALLRSNGLTRAQVNRIRLSGDIGVGGTGGAAINGLVAGNPGNPGNPSHVALIVTTTGGDVELARVTGVAGAAGAQGGLGIGRQGGAAERGNINLDGQTDYPNRDMRVFVNGKRFDFRGGRENPGNSLEGNGNPPGGGGCGGGIAIAAIPGLGALSPPRNGYLGFSGSAHAVYVYTPITKDARDPISDEANLQVEESEEG